MVPRPAVARWPGRVNPAGGRPTAGEDARVSSLVPPPIVLRRPRAWIVAALVGHPPSAPVRVRPFRGWAPWAGLRRLSIDAEGVTVRRGGWRAPFRLPVEELGVALRVVLRWGDQPPATRYLLIDRAGAVRLVIAPGAHRRFVAAWQPVADRVPVVQAPPHLGRAKDVRRQWPEAFTPWAAFPVLWTFGLIAVVCGAGGLIDALR
jgi:hypothetical protein